MATLPGGLGTYHCGENAEQGSKRTPQKIADLQIGNGRGAAGLAVVGADLVEQP